MINQVELKLPKRKTPVKHQVSGYTRRDGTKISTYSRGSGTGPVRKRKVVGSRALWVPTDEIKDLDPIDAEIVRQHIAYINSHPHIRDWDDYSWSSDHVIDYVEGKVNIKFGDNPVTEDSVAWEYAVEQGYEDSSVATALGHYIDWSSEWVPDYVKRKRS